MSITVCNFTNVYENQPFMEGLRRSGEATWIDCTDIPGTDCYCDDEAVVAIRKRIADAGIKNASGIHFFDNGNFHYMSKIWTDMVQEPFSLVIFDHHPDMQEPRFGNILSCGGWVRSALESNPCLRDVWLVGIRPELKGECGGFPDRVHIVGEDALPGLDPVLLAGKVRSGRALYLSVDKDVLRPEDARTDWDQGTMSLDWLCAFAAALGPDLCGVDICGALPASKGGRDEDFSVNSAANRRFHELFSLYL